MSQDKNKRTSKSKAKPRPKPVTIRMPPRDYQPSKAEKEQGVDMPGASMNVLRDVFFRPVKIKAIGGKKKSKPKR